MAVELEADLNVNSDPTNEFVIKGEKRGTGNEQTCKCCDGKLGFCHCMIVSARWARRSGSGGSQVDHLISVK